MALVLSGKEVAAKIKSDTKATTDQLRSNGLTPRLQIIRVGERTDDVYYQKSLEKACADTGIDCKVQVLEEQIGQKGLEEQLTQAAQDPLVQDVYKRQVLLPTEYPLLLIMILPWLISKVVCCPAASTVPPKNKTNIRTFKNPIKTPNFKRCKIFCLLICLLSF